MTFYDELIADADDDPATRVHVERAADRAVVTLDDAAKLNVLSGPLTRQLKSSLAELVADREIRTVVLTGRDPGFSAGGDLRMMERTPKALTST